MSASASTKIKFKDTKKKVEEKVPDASKIEVILSHLPRCHPEKSY